MTENLACMVRHQGTIVHLCGCVGLVHGVPVKPLVRCRYHALFAALAASRAVPSLGERLRALQSARN